MIQLLTIILNSKIKKKKTEKNEKLFYVLSNR